VAVLEDGASAGKASPARRTFAGHTNAKKTAGHAAALTFPGHRQAHRLVARVAMPTLLADMLKRCKANQLQIRHFKLIPKAISLSKQPVRDL
jgi:hypothetical protein